MKIRTPLLTIAAFVLFYFVAGACFFRFGVESLVLPHVALSAQTTAPLFLRIGGDDGNAILVRRYGTPKVGCVVFFPGQHGNISAYIRNLFPAFVAHGIAVLAVAYPGQNGAPGTPHHLHEIMVLATQTAEAAQATCPGHRIVLYGRSLGSMVAAYAAAKTHPAGLILDSAARSFSSAIRLRLNARWYLAPLALLPVPRLLAHDYSLAEALSSMRDVPAVVFQGTADRETPLSDLRAAGMPGNLKLVVVSGGTHSTTDLLARDRTMQTALTMLRAPRT
ncbi:alpha/beta hydrolase [Rhodanobacter glycinis]|jgi:alpha-beta hydrolase superfamily lysophospholipase|uniref:alpha/beta hydrolase n=1 Tax=Rhodanobacter glycinis TaxID=582702 RepID=UPI001FE05E7E|nr:alpha/beta fold hydrolase [Rhodanobacter glycinis]